MYSYNLIVNELENSSKKSGIFEKYISQAHLPFSLHTYSTANINIWIMVFFKKKIKKFKTVKNLRNLEDLNYFQ